jgi:hypothetical protein
MRQNITNNHIKKLDSKLYKANYHDFMLFNGSTMQYSMDYLELNKIADFSKLNIENSILYSDATWKKAINEGVEMKDIGFTGMDNGLISFRYDNITNEKLLDLFKKSTYKIESGDTRFFMSPITGNTVNYEYPLFLNEEEQYLECRGGFFQGFFKLFGHKYQVLPSSLENDITLHFEIRPRLDYEIETKTINYSHPENKGIFFYIGTRAENKFWSYYKTPNNFEISDRNVIFANDEWLNEELEDIPVCPFYEDMFEENKFVEDDYSKEDILIDKNEIYVNSADQEHDKRGYIEIESDNKFLLFDRTDSGFTVDTWVEGTRAVLTRRQNWPNANYFLLMNKTKTGYTVNNINEYNENNSYEYNIYKDIQHNAFALIITDEGAIGYRYAVMDCEAENNFAIVEEYSKDNIVKNNEWNKINIRFSKVNNGNNKMRILFYVNGFLVFISKEIEAFNFRELNDTYQKQEAVPYNISLGGGAIGLSESIIPNNMDSSKYILPIEKYFCGSFLGDIKSFKMYEGVIDYSMIYNYLS